MALSWEKIVLDISRRTLLAGAGSTILSGPARADVAYPTRPVRIIIPYAVGGGTDTVFHLFQRSFEKALGGTVFAEYSGGAATLTGTLKALGAAANGYTLILTTSAISLNTVVLDDARYRMEDVGIISPLVQYPYMLIANKHVPFNSLAEFTAYAKNNPRKLNFVSLGTGSPTYLLTSRLLHSLGVELTPVVYPGTGPAQTDFMTNRVQVQMVAASKQFIDMPDKTILAVAGDERVPLIPDVPTFKEVGYADMVGGTWFGLFAPKGVPEPIVQKLRRAAVAAVAEAAPAFVATGHFPVPGGAEGFPRYIAADLELWKADFARIGGKAK